MNQKRKVKKTTLFTLGVKIIIGVTLISNIFIGILLYVQVHGNEVVGTKVDELLNIQKELSSNLRFTVAGLQDEFLDLPAFFTIDPKGEILKELAHTFGFTHTETLTGRESFSSLYERKERRDLAKGKIVVQQQGGAVIVSVGIFNDAGGFADEVRRVVLGGIDAEETFAESTRLIAQVSARSSGVEAYTSKIQELNARVADSGLEAEKTRNEILEQVEHIESLESELVELKGWNQRLTVIVALSAALANMVILFFLVRWLVEKPLKKLTGIIGRIREGEETEIPFLHRKDQVGVLAGAIVHFKQALEDVRSDNLRRAEEKCIIDQLLNSITSVVDGLDEKAKKLVGTASELESLANDTSSQSDLVALHANSTAEHTVSVSESTGRLQSAFTGITSQVQSQMNSVELVLERNSRCREHMNDLDSAIQAIHHIIGVVSEIADQTKLLALNATIEAARAGEAGQGFGVVAREVKELSVKTSAATVEVMEKVDAIENATGVLVANLKDIDSQVNELNHLTCNITASVDLQLTETTTIAELSEQTSRSTRQVSESMVAVNGAAGKTMALAELVNGYSSEIASQLHQLLEETTRRLEGLAN